MFSKGYYFQKRNSCVCVVYHLRRNRETFWKGHVQVLPHWKGKLDLYLKAPSSGFDNNKNKTKITGMRVFPWAHSQGFLKGILVLCLALLITGSLPFCSALFRCK